MALYLLLIAIRAILSFMINRQLLLIQVQNRRERFCQNLGIFQAIVRLSRRANINQGY